MSFGLVALTIGWFFILISFLVLIHELGHFLAAKLVGVFVEEFGLGYPPRVRQFWKWRGTIFTLNALPFGGFVRLWGDESDSLDEQAPVNEAIATRQVSPAEMFSSQPKWKRLVILLAGIAVNFVFGTIVFAGIYSYVGIPTPTGEVEIAAVASGSPAEAAGVQVGDIVEKVAADSQVREPDTAEEFIQFVSGYAGQEIDVTVKRAGETQNVSLYVRTPEEVPEKQGAIGIALNDTEFRFFPWWQMPLRGMVAGLEQALGMGWEIVMILRNMVVQLFTRGEVPREVSGIVGIVDQGIEAGIVKQGVLSNLHLGAALSINLAIMNLLPIPALDGGRALFVVLEPVLGVARRKRWEQRANQYGFVFLIGLIVAITIKDIVGIFL
jgi:regulator of sigma E protease